MNELTQEDVFTGLQGFSAYKSRPRMDGGFAELVHAASAANVLLLTPEAASGLNQTATNACLTTCTRA